MSVALLVSSAGLAASLLVGAAMRPAEVRYPSWQATAAAVQAAKRLSRQPGADVQALPVSLSSMVPTYPLVATAAAGTTLPSPASHQLAEQPIAVDADELPSTLSLRSTMQSSWRTFKLAFR